MFNVDTNWIPYLNTAVVLIFVFCFVKGWKHGVLRTLISLCATALAVYGAWCFSGILAKYVSLWPAAWTPLQDTVYAQAVYQVVNKVAWFLMLFLLIRIALIVVDYICRGIQKVPVLKQVSEILGGAVGMIEGVVWCLILCIFLSTPIFTNGTAAVKESFLQTIQDSTMNVISAFAGPVTNTEDLSDLLSSGSELTQTQQTALEDWLKENGYTEIK